jgi:hypothetical protein
VSVVLAIRGIGVVLLYFGKSHSTLDALADLLGRPFAGERGGTETS